MSKTVYAQIEHHGPPKSCEFAVVATRGNNGMVLIRRAGAPAIWLSGSRHAMAKRLAAIACELAEKEVVPWPSN